MSGDYYSDWNGNGGAEEEEEEWGEEGDWEWEEDEEEEENGGAEKTVPETLPPFPPCLTFLTLQLTSANALLDPGYPALFCLFQFQYARFLCTQEL